MTGVGSTVDLVSDHDRLEAACRELRAHGILAAGAVPGDPAGTRARLRAALLSRYPAAVGSMVFWTVAAEDCFGATGDLERPLVLHVDGPGAAAAVCAALARFGLTAVEGPVEGTLQVPPGR